ncbi:MAG: S41 family peptidase, partial [Phycisphaerae bacterium]|nr:S41 family peptidase [Phycisphaerae bacterium]
AGRLQTARNDDYQNHLKKLNEKVKLCRWRESLLATSTGYDIEVADKSELEGDLREKLQESWLAALAQLAATHSLAERLDLVDTVAPSLRDEIIQRSTVIAKQLQADGMGLDAYTKVYYYLEVLDKKLYQFTDLHDRLLREATLKAIYIPDPNAEGIDWADKREGVNVDMIISALATLDVGYVESPAYKEMTLKALEYCRLLAKTEGLEETFETLKDEVAVKTYLDGIDELIKLIEPDDAADYTFKNLLVYLDKVITLNRTSMNFPVEVMLAEFTEGAFAGTDTYTYVIWPYDVSEFRKSMTNEFSGVGVVIRKGEDDYLRADSLVSYDTPAYRAGMDANDVILEVDGRSTKGLTIEKAVKLITGPTGTDVVLKVKRDSFEAPQELTVTRQQVVVPTVKGLYRDIDGQWEYMLDEKNGIAYMALTHFSGETPASLLQTLKMLKARKGMKGLVFDLRNNGGGYLTGAISVVNAFVKEGSRIVSSRYRAGQMEDVKFAKAQEVFDTEIPMVVLVNSISASASEIVSGALKDNGRALLVGTRTYGKGSVQTIQPLRNSSFTAMTGAQMKMTIAHYYLPNGRCVHRDPKDNTNEDYGVEPDIKVEVTNGQFLDQFIKTQRQAGILHHDKLPNVKRDWKIFTSEEVIASDPQLEMALLCLRSQFLQQEVVVSRKVSKTD